MCRHFYMCGETLGTKLVSNGFTLLAVADMIRKPFTEKDIEEIILQLENLFLATNTEMPIMLNNAIIADVNSFEMDAFRTGLLNSMVG